MPGHPAMKVGADHKKKFEAWMAEEFELQVSAERRTWPAISCCFWMARFQPSWFTAILLMRKLQERRRGHW